VTISIRLRLTLWYAVAVTALLAVIGVSLTVVHGRISLARLDSELRRLNDAVATVLTNELAERRDHEVAAEEALVEVVVSARHLAILAEDGTVLAQRWRLSTPPMPPPTAQGEHTWTIGAPPAVRVIARALPPVPRQFVIVTAASWDELYADRSDLIRTMLAVFPVALAVTAASAWWVAGRALRPAAAMAAEAGRLTEHSAGRRLTVGRPDELGQLAVAFNGLVERLESALAARRHFLAEASHELRTPVSIARTAADVALSRADRSDTEYREALDIVSAQMRHLGRIVSDLLTLARSDSADWPIATSDFYFDELLTEVVRTTALLSQVRHVTIEAACRPELQVCGDEGLLRQMLFNLLENAIRHTPAGGTVSATVDASGGVVTVSIQDSGQGIAEADRERIFERFVHLPVPDSAPRPDGGGTGLGLAIARRIARAHGGDLTLVSAGPEGARFAVTLAIAAG
jgi:signal transduction histidine kinase